MRITLTHLTLTEARNNFNKVIFANCFKFFSHEFLLLPGPFFSSIFPSLSISSIYCTISSIATNLLSYTFYHVNQFGHLETFTNKTITYHLFDKFLLHYFIACFLLLAKMVKHFAIHAMDRDIYIHK